MVGSLLAVTQTLTSRGGQVKRGDRPVGHGIRRNEPSGPLREMQGPETTKPRWIAGLCVHYLAVREGFEPSIRFPVYTLSRRAPSTTRTPHQIPFGVCAPSRPANLVECFSKSKFYFSFSSFFSCA